MSANDTQVGGDHYKGEYQHWDFVCDTGMHYLLGCATKYISRWRKKNGVEDLKKALHYVEKACERHLPPFPYGGISLSLFQRYTKEMPLMESNIIYLLGEGKYIQAKTLINELLLIANEHRF